MDIIKIIWGLFKNPWVIFPFIALVLGAYALGRNNGYEDAKTDQEIIDGKAQKRIDSVPTVDSAGTIDRLRKGTF